MTDRTDVSFDEIEAHYSTYKTAIPFNRDEEYGSADVGKPVKISAARTVALAGLDERIIGVLHHVEPDGRCVIQDGGYCRILGQGTLNGSVVGNTGNIVKAGTPAAGTGIGHVVEVGADYVIVRLP